MNVLIDLHPRPIGRTTLAVSDRLKFDGLPVKKGIVSLGLKIDGRLLDSD